MRYIWQILLNGQEQNIDEKDISFKPTTSANPYTEVSLENINQKLLDGKPIEVNAYYRLGYVYDRLLEENIFENDASLRELLFDVLTHGLAWIDMRAGLCLHEYYGLFLKEDLIEGRFGKRYRSILEIFPHDKIRYVIDAMVALYQNGPSFNLLETVFRGLYKYSILYLDIRKQRELLIYIGQKKTPQLERQVEFLTALFVPFDDIVHLFWDKHFGIIGVDETMQIGEFEIY